MLCRRPLCRTTHRFAKHLDLCAANWVTFHCPSLLATSPLFACITRSPPACGIHETLRLALATRAVSPPPMCPMRTSPCMVLRMMTCFGVQGFGRTCRPFRSDVTTADPLFAFTDEPPANQTRAQIASLSSKTRFCKSGIAYSSLCQSTLHSWTLCPCHFCRRACFRKLCLAPAGPQRLLRHREVVRGVQLGVASDVVLRLRLSSRSLSTTMSDVAFVICRHKSQQLNVILLLDWSHDASAYNPLVLSVIKKFTSAYGPPPAANFFESWRSASTAGCPFLVNSLCQSQLGEPALHLPTSSTLCMGLGRGFVIRDHAGATTLAPQPETLQDVQLLSAPALLALFAAQAVSTSAFSVLAFSKNCVSCAKRSSIDFVRISSL